MKNINTEVTKIQQKNNHSLHSAFVQAMKDPDFKSIVETIPLKEEEIMKYTSKIESCALDSKRCHQCPSILACQNEVTGYYLYPEKQGTGLTFTYVPCKYKRAINKENKYQQHIYFFDIPKEIRDAHIKSIFPGDKNRSEVIKYLSHFAKEYKQNKTGKGLYLHGNFGSGKTYLIAAVLNELANQGIEVAIVYWPEMLRELKSSFDDDFKEKFNYIKKIPILFIDDIGAENVTPWNRDEILGPILQYRMQESLSTFFTSNLNIEELEQHLSNTYNKVDAIKSKRIIERINKLTQDMEMVAKNNRK